MIDENISSNKEAKDAQRGLNKARLQTIQDRTPELPPVPPAPPKMPENLAQEEQPGAAQLYRKLQNRFRRRQTERFGGKIEKGQAVSGIGLYGRFAPAPSLSVPAEKEEEKGEEEGPFEEITGEEREYARQEKSLSKQLDKELRKQQKREGKGKAISERSSKRTQSLRKELELVRLRKQAAGYQKKSGQAKRKIYMLMPVLGVAMLKDFLDFLGELFSLGIWSWFDWILDVALGLAAFLLQIEKDPKSRMMSWTFVGLEIIPYVGDLPFWTYRVANAMVKCWKEIIENSQKINNLQKKIKKIESKK